ncbi:hypothetical protein A0H76_2080 [Hepatospora eriocheir]|uniref:Uncharacterized protein n=1 Tax=Hepatospora eriocheir TaxID=1081669 RepID=A0A1X0QK70_9MICR|nr:hypothetical protein A0H76_2080 [Hepatospora eriocheir]
MSENNEDNQKQNQLEIISIKDRSDESDKIEIYSESNYLVGVFSNSCENLYENDHYSESVGSESTNYEDSDYRGCPCSHCFRRCHSPDYESLESSFYTDTRSSQFTNSDGSFDEKSKDQSSNFFFDKSNRLSSENDSKSNDSECTLLKPKPIIEIQSQTNSNADNLTDLSDVSNCNCMYGCSNCCSEDLYMENEIDYYYDDIPFWSSKSDSSLYDINLSNLG